MQTAIYGDSEFRSFSFHKRKTQFKVSTERKHWGGYLSMRANQAVINFESCNTITVSCSVHTLSVAVRQRALYFHYTIIRNKTISGSLAAKSVISRSISAIPRGSAANSFYNSQMLTSNNIKQTAEYRNESCILRFACLRSDRRQNSNEIRSSNEPL